MLTIKGRVDKRRTTHLWNEGVICSLIVRLVRTKLRRVDDFVKMNAVKLPNRPG